MRPASRPARLPVLSLLVLLGAGLGCGRDADPVSASKSPAPGSQSARAASEAPVVPRAEPRVVFETAKGEVSATVEVVSTPAKIQRGLMHRTHMAPDRGMLFVFGGDRVRSFWMKNTLIPLDMMFVKSDLEVAGVVRDTEPLTTEPRTIGIKTRYVIEVNAGWTAKHGIDAGTKIRFENLPEIKSPPL